MRIDEVEGKSPDIIASYWRVWELDPYHMTILLAAILLTRKLGKDARNYEYRTQWSKGSTLWVYPHAGISIVVPCLLPGSYSFDYPSGVITFGEDVVRQ